LFEVVSLFSGCGGLDLGLEQTNKFKVVWGNDKYYPSAKTFSENSKLELTEDGRAQKGKFFLNTIELADFSNLEDVDIVTGGPPCQDFSLVRGGDKRMGIEVKRGRLYTNFVASLIALQPKAFIFENVKGLLSANRGLAFKQIVSDFKNLKVRWYDMLKNGQQYPKIKSKNIRNYRIIFSSTLDFSKLGVPQRRERVILIGIREDILGKEDFERERNRIYNNLPNRNDIIYYFPLTPIEVFSGRVLEDLQDDYIKLMCEYKDVFEKISSIRSEEYKMKIWNRYTFDIWRDYFLINGYPNSVDEDVKENIIRRHEEILKELGFFKKPVYDLVLPDGSNSIPKETRAVVQRMAHIPPGENHEFVRGTQYEVKALVSNIYKRLHPLKPSPTIIARGGGGTWGYHFLRERQKLTNRERARIQTFPDKFLFIGNFAEVRRQIGEAVPPLASKRIAEALLPVLNMS